MDGIKAEKAQLRKCILDKRALLPVEEVKEKSARIIDRIRQLNEFAGSKWIMSYIDFRNEVQTREFIQKCILAGKSAAVPFVFTGSDNKKVLWACEIKNIEEDLQTGTFGILEPKDPVMTRIDPSILDMIIIPGAVFDSTKQRIGYGAGFYDRFLNEVSGHSLKIGVAFEFQVLHNIPYEEHDVPLDMIITEDRII